MRRLVSFLKSRLAPSPPPPPDIDPEALREAFRKRYSRFRSLLTANNNALQAMADLERLYYGKESYRMAVIRSKVTTLLVSVYKMVRDLIAMGDGKYQELLPVFEKISAELTAIIERKPDYRSGPLILPLPESDRKRRDLVGDKMAHLGELGHLPGIKVPPGFVVTAAATRYFLADLLDEINRRLQILESDDLDGLYRTCAGLRELIINAPLPADLEELLQVHYARLEKRLGPDCRVALRSSALGEDSRGVSFAGLYNTLLDADRTGLAAGYKEVIAGKYGARAIAYRRRRGYRHEDIEMCVGCMAMVDARFGGVIYTRDPAAGGSDVLRLNVARGFGKGVVDGTSASDLILLDRRPPHVVIDTEQPVGKAPAVSAIGAALGEQVLQRLARIALQIEEFFQEAQDIEWAIDQAGDLFILQSRPLLLEPSPPALPDPEPIIVESPVSAELLISGGVVASGGISSGPVCRLELDQPIAHFPKGGVLVVEHPLPDWAPLLNQACAVIAETGSEAGHLATVSREFGIPALFGLADARQVLADGQIITVAADKRAVYAGRCEELLTGPALIKDPMAGSPVQKLLGDALALITPLNLTDPEATQFKPSWCETLHDITRYCHEKSVAAMFGFSRNHRFDERRAKRIMGKVPLEWWVIDLADGFRQGVDGTAPTIAIDDIVSLPMQAIWRGIAAYPWQGPPPVSVRGFGSIIFQSAMRPELDPAVASRLTVKNYFLVSKNFCHLSVRLGYHYALVEGYLSELLTESYVTFRFKGGAADAGRKELRIQLIAGILEQYGFRVEQQSDTLLARIKKRPAAYLEERLQILGYLTMHTRQIDMIMDQAGAFERYREKFISDIEAMFTGKVDTGEAVR